MIKKSTLPQTIIIMSLIFLVLGVFTPLPAITFGTGGALGTLIGWIMYMVKSKIEESDNIIDAEFTTSDTEKVTFDERLRKLEQIKKEGLITDQEYQKKREEIMKDLW